MRERKPRKQKVRILSGLDGLVNMGITRENGKYDCSKIRKAGENKRNNN